MPTPLLTIIVPTYKRSANLAVLLQTLREETSTIGEDVVVQVSDNCSPDDTPQVVARIAEGWPALRGHRHATNIGADRNFCHCVEAVQTRWFWIIGDDDLPKRGVIAQMVGLLRERQPALLYMQSEWMNPVRNPEQGERVGTLRVSELDAESFARALHIWVTYISGMVIDRERLDLVLQAQPIDRFTGSSLVQLGWVLPLLKAQGPFIFVKDRGVLATTDNSGGYPLLTVFCVNFPRIVNDIFGKASPLSQALLGSAMSKFLPGRIWAARTSTSGAYSAEDPWKEMRHQLGDKWMYWILLMPIGRLPMYLAQPLYQSWRILNRLRIEWMRLLSA